MYRRYIKRLLDILISMIAMIVLIPLYVFIALMVYAFMGYPVLFSQERIGKDEEVFRLYKFRSMTNAKDENGNLLDEQLRLTKFGIFLRSTSLDELPELWSIFIGKMSFIGPRPLPTYYGPYYFEDEKIRHKVRGGLIPPDGLCGNTTPDWETQFSYDKEYAENLSFLLDVKVVFATFRILFSRMKNNYGAEDRPHLNEYRAWMDKEETANDELSVR